MDDLIIEYSVRSALDGTFVCQPPTVRYRWINPAAFGGHRIIMAPPDSVRFIGESLYFMRVDSGMSEDEAARLAESDVVTDDQAPPQPEDKEELWNASDVRKSAVGGPGEAERRRVDEILAAPREGSGRVRPAAVEIPRRR